VSRRLRLELVITLVSNGELEVDSTSRYNSCTNCIHV
jgi:hypothetical protein